MALAKVRRCRVARLLDTAHQSEQRILPSGIQMVRDTTADDRRQAFPGRPRLLFQPLVLLFLQQYLVSVHNTLQ
jgi:hypothetical protein